VIRLRRILVLFCLLAVINTANADQRLELALAQAAQQADSFADETVAYNWLKKMSRRLRYQIPNPFYRTELLRLVHQEAIRSDLPAELVMAVIQVESSFNRYAVSNVGARGLMQLMPFWIKEIGHPHDDLFNPATNLRYGCMILKNYVRQSKGNLDRALSMYHGSLQQRSYAIKVRRLMKQLLVG
jgi:soluble lytic murein transglycosylase-like protein